MPRGDRTGPEGQGPMTGWGAGDCAEDEMFEVNNIRGAGAAGWPGRGGGRGYGGRGMGPCGGMRGTVRGGGRAMRRGRGGARGWAGPGMAYGPWQAGPAPASYDAATWQSAPPVSQDESADLRQQAEMLRAEIERIQQRLDELDES